MRSLLEKAIVHLLNGDDEKASALFHKFMVERARQIHESLRQDGEDESLDEDWDSEIKEEEYFDDDELGDDADTMAPEADGSGSPIDGDMSDDGAPADDAMSDDAGDDVGDDMPGGDDMGGDSEPGLEGKIDDLTDKIDQLTAEFDRVMSEFHDDDSGDDMPPGDDDMGGDMPDVDGDMGGDDSADSGDLANRMEDDMGDDDTADEHAQFESEMPDFIKDKMKDKDKDKDDKKEEVSEEDESADEETDDDDEGLDESDDLKDITESVLDELEKISPVANTEHRGLNNQKGNITTGPKNSPLPRHNVMDRVKGEPVMTKGPTHKGYAREEAPKVDPANDLVKNVRPANRRKSWSDTMKEVGPKGDDSALINKDFTPGGPKPTKSIVDGKTKKG